MKVPVLALLLLIVFVSCIAPGGGGGIIYNKYSGPFQALENPKGNKTGRAAVECFLGMVCRGDASVAAASSNGGITRISSVDYEYLSYLTLLYSKTTIIVTGE